MNKFLEKNHKKIKQINSHIYSDYFFYDNSNRYTTGIYYFLLSDFLRRSEIIKNNLNLKNGIQVVKKQNNLYLIKNFYENYVPIEIVNIKCRDNQNIKTINIRKNVNIFLETSVKLDQIKDINLKCEYFNFKNKLDGNIFTVKLDLINSEYDHENFKINNADKWSKYFYKKENKLFLFENITKISEDIYIPSGFEINILPGQKILLINDAFILSHSNWLIGGKNKETVISGLKDNLGGGLIILDNDKKSEIINTKFEYLRGYNLNDKHEYFILGAINFHQTEVDVDQLKFENIFSEDAINIFRSKFK